MIKNNSRWLLLLIFTAIFYSCSPKLASTISSKQPPLPDNAFVLVLQKEDSFTNDGIEIGTIHSGDNGLSANCTYNEVISQLRQMARRNGANLMKITDYKPADQWSSCDRITATIYKVPDFRTHEKEIEWTADRKLTWEDFKGSPKPISNEKSAAQTYCGFGYQTNRVTVFKKAKIFAKNTFDCRLSWVRPDQKSRTDLLEHEQGHFDLCEVFARQLRKKLEEKRLNAMNLNDAKVVFSDVYAEYLNRQELYENETNFGLNRQKQTEWTARIGIELAGLKVYAAE
ncbi:MAG: hypothetical protein Q8918_19335 [Bacteroidota bacterium]|nr:hypothetical protein [Bacteroidota bacterium]